MLTKQMTKKATCMYRELKQEMTYKTKCNKHCSIAFPNNT